jgi:hypothetical protein
MVAFCPRQQNTHPKTTSDDSSTRTAALHSLILQRTSIRKYFGITRRNGDDLQLCVLAMGFRPSCQVAQATTKTIMSVSANVDSAGCVDNVLFLGTRDTVFSVALPLVLRWWWWCWGWRARFAYGLWCRISRCCGGCGAICGCGVGARGAGVGSRGATFVRSKSAGKTASGARARSPLCKSSPPALPSRGAHARGSRRLALLALRLVVWRDALGRPHSFQIFEDAFPEGHNELGIDHRDMRNFTRRPRRACWCRN